MTGSKNYFVIDNVHAGLKNKHILRGVDLKLKPGDILALMGPNGSGKSTLAHVIMGHPDFKATKGKVWWHGKNLLKLEPWQRSREGIFLAFQYPHEVPGVNFYEFLNVSYQARDRKSTRLNSSH